MWYFYLLNFYILFNNRAVTSTSIFTSGGYLITMPFSAEDKHATDGGQFEHKMWTLIIYDILYQNFQTQLFEILLFCSVTKNWLFCWVQCVLCATFCNCNYIMLHKEYSYNMQLQTKLPESKFPNEYSDVIFIQIDQKVIAKIQRGPDFMKHSVVPEDLMFYPWCFFFLFYYFRQTTSELPRPIAVKLRHMIAIWVRFIMQIQKFGGPLPPKLRAQNLQNLTTFDFDREYFPNVSTCRKSEK